MIDARAARPQQASPRAAMQHRAGSGTASGRRLLHAWLLIGALGTGITGCQREHETRYVSDEVRRATLRENISATGEVSARVKVNVGSQVSGTVSKLYVDFNSHVKKDEILAELDPRLFAAQLARSDATVAVAEAEVEKAKVTLQDAERTVQRYVDLLASKMLAQADYDTAQTARDAARAAVKGAQAQLLQAQADRNQMATNLAFTKIRSPIEGVVIDRQVDAGQTVAAQFQVATLFVIANDMRHVRILADIDEADIGRVHDGMPVTFEVDAYPRTKFKGTIRAMRQAPTSTTSTSGTTTTSNVVTYAADIDADNPNNSLRQGMTAQVTVLVSEHADVITLPNAALRYRPKDRGNKSDNASKADDANKAGNKKEVEANPKPANSPETQSDEGGEEAPAHAVNNTRQAHVYVLVKDKPEVVTVRLGGTDGHRTEVLDGLKEGDTVITGELGNGPGGRRGLF